MKFHGDLLCASMLGVKPIHKENKILGFMTFPESTFIMVEFPLYANRLSAKRNDSKHPWIDILWRHTDIRNT